MGKKSRNEEVVEEVVVEEVVEKVEEVAKAEATPIKIGDHVKINNDIEYDMFGKRIHNGIKNYNYTVKLVRVDGYLVVECLTHSFVIKQSDVTKIEV